MSKDNHGFNVHVAKLYSIDVAIFLESVAYWMHLNEANNTNYHDGRWWTYNSQEAFTKIFPYWSRDQIKRLIKKCIDHGLLMSGNYNKVQYDRTNWYTLTDKGMDLYNIPIGRNRPIEVTIPPNGIDDIAQPIPITNSVTNSVTNNNRATAPVDKSPCHRNRSTEKRKAKASSVNLCEYPDDFYPDEIRRQLLSEHARRTNTNEHELLIKFETVSKKYKTKSKDWQQTFQEFIERERPKKVYEDKTGRLRRHDNQPLHH